MQFQILTGDCVESMKTMESASVDSIVTDPPYELGFMGKGWDRTGIANSVAMWKEALRVLKPGGHLLAFSGSRTYHRMVCAIEDAGFDIRDQIMWVYGSGFPKSLDVSKALDKAAGAERVVTGRTKTPFKVDAAAERGRSLQGSVNGDFSKQVDDDDYRYTEHTAPATDAARQWQGWGTALKPAHEPIVVARKPLIGTVAANVLAHGTGAINVDGCRVGAEDMSAQFDRSWNQDGTFGNGKRASTGKTVVPGRWPANLIHDGSDEVIAAFPETGKSTGGGKANGDKFGGGFAPSGADVIGFGDTGSAARFFYCAKATKSDRSEGNIHPTVKPTDLMRYLVRLVTPPGGLVLDPFAGSGSTGKAVILEGFRFVGCELSPEYAAIAEARISLALASMAQSKQEEQLDIFAS